MQRVGFGFSVRPGRGTLTRSNRLGADMTYLKLKTLDEYFVMSAYILLLEVSITSVVEI